MPVNILVVEDDEDIAGLVAYNLERQGWKVELIHNGSEGLDAVRAHAPDFVILDVMLPGWMALLSTGP